MKKFFAVIAFMLTMFVSANAATVSVPAGSTSAQIQTLVNSAASGSTIQFTGTDNISSTITVPCNSLTFQGPATLHWSGTPGAGVIFNATGCSNLTFTGLTLDNTGGIYLNGPFSNLTVTNNKFTTLPGTENQFTNPGLYLYGASGSGTISNSTITGNTFGDANSCTAVVTNTTTDQGGACAGIIFQANFNGVTLKSNTFTHLEEGYHVLCYGDVCTGSSSPSWTNFDVENNDFNNIHRIAAEMQPQNASNVTFAHNSYENALNPTTFSMGWSFACCAGISRATVPSVTDNLLLANIKPAGSYIAYAIEWWGNGATAANNVIQGYWANGIVWGLGASPWSVTNNVIQGPYMGGQEGCYVCSEKEQSTSVPTQSGNTTGLTVSALTSTAPTIALSGTVATVSNAGTNTSTWFTVDGTTPVPGQGTAQQYLSPVTLASGATIKAVGMWGSGANPTSFPTGYGYVPSVVVSATNSVTPPPVVTLVSAYMSATPTGANTIVGSTASFQLQVNGTYSDGSTGVVPNNQITWGTLGSGVLAVSSTGVVTGIGNGKDNVTATIGTVKSSQWTVTVSGINPPPPPPPPPAMVCTPTQSGTTLTIVCTNVQ